MRGRLVELKANRTLLQIERYWLNLKASPQDVPQKHYFILFLEQLRNRRGLLVLPRAHKIKFGDSGDRWARKYEELTGCLPTERTSEKGNETALFLCVGVLYDRHKTRLVRYYGGLVSTMPNFSTIFFFFTLANMSLPGTSSFIGEFLILVGAFQINSLVATLAALGMILGATYSLWLYNRVVSGNLKPDFLHKFSDLNGREVFIFIPFLVGVVWMGVYPKVFPDCMHTSVRSNVCPFVKQRIQTSPNNEETSPEMQTRKTQGRIQNLKEKLETLKAFLSKGVNRSSSVYKVRNEVINNISYQWNKEAETSFQRWKNCMEAVPTVVPQIRGEVLSLHIAASPDEISAMLFAERRRMQIPIYFVSRALPDVEQSYAASEKLILALVHATRRLRRYFKDHPIRVLADKPLERASLNPDGTRRVVKWAKELEEYDIEYEKK
ncbi:NADH dehydrogenase subunit 4, mitochondrion [Artemisia annua]|uniref:NADH-ubiquinone oxidoreductase chain 4 n=1 Tax=Artemisia annua TaxID=35608 RepID=A0A2U1NMR7_ARTAN|nr:NADH dehydrogenase subunit 4, mitochondrion [Artemisia annua]